MEPGEIVFVHIGQIGCRIGDACWDRFRHRRLIYKIIHKLYLNRILRGEETKNRLIVSSNSMRAKIIDPRGYFWSPTRVRLVFDLT